MTRGTQDTDILQAALIGYRHQIAEIEAKMADIQGKLDGTPAAAPAATRRRMAAAQKKRRAAVRADKAVEAKSPAKPAPAKKRRISAAGRQRIIEATKKRWAAYRAQKAAAGRA